jgi:hypothetical protein
MAGRANQTGTGQTGGRFNYRIQLTLDYDEEEVCLTVAFLKQLYKLTTLEIEHSQTCICIYYFAALHYC